MQRAFFLFRDVDPFFVAGRDSLLIVSQFRALSLGEITVLPSRPKVEEFTERRPRRVEGNRNRRHTQKTSSPSVAKETNARGSWMLISSKANVCCLTTNFDPATRPLDRARRWRPITTKWARKYRSKPPARSHDHRAFVCFFFFFGRSTPQRVPARLSLNVLLLEAHSLSARSFLLLTCAREKMASPFIPRALKKSKRQKKTHLDSLSLFVFLNKGGRIVSSCCSASQAELRRREEKTPLTFSSSYLCLEWLQL